ncbi:hypothetical protein M9H77_01021 [Catharanthus roseus]|uniref:Uncharacterized protein n=1 Tax=Catharanthus roseus TaxID=4058 RepID=A0ACC0C4H2_CATRO|nr:hypothetical protein M9H77_01021 [Catharanthus roseus]
MQTKITNSSIKPIKTKSEEIYAARLLSREMSLNNSSSEVYYGGNSVAIPFRWESQPGTPKVKFPEKPLPPLTPPPSYLSSPAKKNYVAKKHSKSNNFLHAVFPKLINQRKNQFLSSSPAAASSSLSWSSSSSSSSISVPSSPNFTPRSARGHEKLSAVRLSFDSRAEEVDHESPVSTLCFGNRGGYSSRVIKLLLGESHLVTRN